MKTSVSKITSLLGVAVLGVCSASAISLLPGTSIPSVPEPDPIGGGPIASMSVPFVAPTFSGTLISKVWAGDLSNPFPGGLTFTYELFNNAVSPDPIDRFTLSSYAGFQTDASYQALIPPVLAPVIPTSVVRNPSGNQISFNFTGLFEGTLIQGASSPILVIQTDSQGFQNSIAGVINSSTANVATFAPLAVPEPAAAALMLLGGLALAVRRKS